MKKTDAFLMLATVIGSIGLTSSAMATTSYETMELGVDFEISKCTTAGSQSSCDATASMPSNIAIELSNCSSSQGATTCWGTWQNTISRDGHSFTASIEASKWMYIAGGAVTTNYNLSATVGATDSSENTSIQINPRGGVLNDSVSFYGPRLTVPNSSDSYTPSVLIAPKMPTPQQN